MGNNIVMWSESVLAHQSVIEDNVFLSIQCVVSGFCNIGEYSFLGANCIIKDNVKTGKINIVGSDAVVVKDMQEGRLLVGVPAKPESKSSFEVYNVTEDWLFT